MEAGYKGKRVSEGYSLMEIVIVILLIGVVAAVIANRWSAVDQINLIHQADRLVADLRHAQSLAMAWEQPLQLIVLADGYSVNCVNGAGVLPCLNAGDVVSDPARQQSFAVTLDTGVGLSGAQLQFDEFGRPVVLGSLLASRHDLVLSGGGSSVTVSVHPISGFLSVSAL